MKIEAIMHEWTDLKLNIERMRVIFQVISKVSC